MELCWGRSDTSGLFWFMHIQPYNRAIPCQRSEGKGQRQKVDFFLWNVKDNRANWWFWPFFEQLLQFGSVFSQKSEIPKSDRFEKVKIEEKKKNLRLKNLCQISYIPFLLYEFYDFVNLCCHLQCFRPFFLLFLWFSCFSILWKMRSSQRQATFNVSISQLNKTSYQIKSPDQRL